jgi:hypothetical protein
MSVMIGAGAYKPSRTEVHHPYLESRRGFRPSKGGYFMANNGRASPSWCVMG